MKTFNRSMIILLIICTLNYLNGCTKKAAVSSSEITPDSRYRITSVKVKDSTVVDLPFVTRSEIQDSQLLIHTNKEIPLQIPISDIDSIYYKKFSPGRTILLAVGVTLAVSVVATIIASCPYVYSYDGQQFVFNGEPYGGSICEGLERTDFVQLGDLKPVNNEYKILLTNETNETQHTDEFRLWVIDHPVGVQVIPDKDGNLFTVSDPLPCLNATDKKGLDLTNWLQDRDDLNWKSDLDGIDPDKKEDLRDTLYLTFPLQNHGGSAKLLVRGCNTLWGSLMLAKVLDLYGREVDMYLESFNDPVFRENNLQWHKREEVLRLQVRIWDGKEWQVRGEIMGGGPMKAENRIVPLDLSGMEGDEVRIMLTPPPGFWELDYFGMDYSEEVPFSFTELSPKSAVNHTGKNIRSELDRHDNSYYVMPETGNHGILAFDVPQEQEAMQRTVLGKISGFYNIHLEAEGDMDLEKINSLAFESGYITRYSLREFAEFQEQLLSHINDR